MNAFVRCTRRSLPSALFVLAIGVATPSSAQVATGLDSFRHTYHPEHGYMPLSIGYGIPAYGYGYGTGTAAQGAGIGIGQAAQGLGQMHLQNAQAAGAYEEAVNQYIQNQGLAEQTIQQNASEKRQAEEQAQAREKAQDRAQVAMYHEAMEQMSAAHRLTAEQFDMDRGVLHWPLVLRSPQFDELRQTLDRLYDARTPEDSGPDSDGYGGIVKACEAMLNLVKEDAKAGMSVTDYVTAKHFISSIEYEAQFRVKAPQAGSAQQADSRPETTSSRR